jgi:hypothetical protein
MSVHLYNVHVKNDVREEHYHQSENLRINTLIFAQVSLNCTHVHVSGHPCVFA